MPQDDAAASEGDPGDVDAPPADLQPCQRFAGGRWRQTSGGMELNACVRSLFSGHCERQGGAAYGRWGEQTLRLVTGRVEVSDDNQSFRLLAVQGADCNVDPVP